MRDLARRILSLRGALYLATRFGGTTLRRMALSGKHASGRWDFLEKSAVPEMVALVERHCGNGRILDMGCGAGSLGASLNPAAYDAFLGVEISELGIARARNRQLAKARFQVGDIHRFDTSERFDAIVFEETLYYVNPLVRRKTLRRYSRMLAPGGKIIVTVAHPKRFAGMLDAIRQDYDVLEDRTFANSCRRLMVFRSRARPNPA